MGMPRRPDQAFAPPSAPFAPGSQSGIFRGRLVVISTASAGSGLFVYSGVPAAGNPPELSITSGTLDPFGNTVVPLLEVAGTGGNKIVASTPAGLATLNFYTGTATEALNASIISGATGSGPTEQQDWTVFGPENTVSPDRAILELVSSVHNQAGSATGFLIYQDTAGTDHQLIDWGGLGVSRQSLAGLAGGIPLNQMDLFTRPINTTGVQSLTRDYTIPGSDASTPGGTQTTYHLRAWGNGNAGNPADNATWTISMFGTTVYTIGPLPWAGAGNNFNWLIDADVMISGNSATAAFIVGGFMMFVDLVAGTSVTQPIIGGATVNNLASGAMKLTWNWAAVTGGATISSLGSVFTRKGV